MPRTIKKRTVVPSRTHDATGAFTGSSFDFHFFVSIEFMFIITEILGTNPTIDFDLEVSPDNSNWVKQADVTQITANGNYRHILILTGSINYRVTAPAMGGTSSPSATIEVIAVGKD